jgi:hypothetical protein
MPRISLDLPTISKDDLKHTGLELENYSKEIKIYVR